MVKWDVENYMDESSTFHMIKYYVLKSQSHYPDTPKYMKALSGENTDEYFKAMHDVIQNIMRRDTWEIILRKSVSDHNVIKEIWSFKCRMKLD